jgi:glycosyltransferase involved in cell wall biosynthesis
MAMKRPVIATNVGDIPEIIHDNKDGLLVPLHSPSRIAESIELLHSDRKLRQKFGRAGNANVHDYYDLNKIFAKVQTIYDLIPSA